MWSGKDDGFVRVPDEANSTPPWTTAAYLHITSNETIHGVEFPARRPCRRRPADLRLVVRLPLAAGRHRAARAALRGRQKNAGPAGVTIVIVRDDLLARIPDGLPPMLDYRTYVEHGSMYNTPPVFAIYVLMLVTRWLRDEVGGLEKQLDRNREKAALLYDAIDGSDGFYRGHAEPARAP